MLNGEIFVLGTWKGRSSLSTLWNCIGGPDQHNKKRKEYIQMNSKQ